MPLISVNLPDSLSSSLVSLLTRIAVALERLAGPELHYNPSPTTLSDYAHITPEAAYEMQQAGNEFAAAHMLVPGSPAYLAAIEEFERQVEAYGGAEAVNQLPWRAPGEMPQSQT
jgi:hypothetical protein